MGRQQISMKIKHGDTWNIFTMPHDQSYKTKTVKCRYTGIKQKENFEVIILRNNTVRRSRGSNNHFVFETMYIKDRNIIFC